MHALPFKEVWSSLKNSFSCLEPNNQDDDNKYKGQIHQTCSLNFCNYCCIALTDPFNVFENKSLRIVLNGSTGMFGAVCPQMPTTEPWSVYMYFHVTDQDVGSSSTLIAQSFTTPTRTQWNRDGCRPVTFQQNTQLKRRHFMAGLYGLNLRVSI